MCHAASGSWFDAALLAASDELRCKPSIRGQFGAVKLDLDQDQHV